MNSPDPSSLDALEAALDNERYLEAAASLRGLSDLRSWRGPRQRVIAGRLASHLGAPRLARVLHLLAGREHPRDPDALLAALRQQLNTHGPSRVWCDLEDAKPIFDDATSEQRAEALALRAYIASTVRDFEVANRDLDAALELDERPWIRLQRAVLLEHEDRLDEAEEHVDELLAERPWSRAPTQMKVHLRRYRGDDDGALMLLFQATHHVDYGYLHLQLAQIQSDLELWDDAAASVDRFIELAPLLTFDDAGQRGIDMLRGQIAYHRGELEAAANFYEKAGKRQLRDLIERLRDPQIEDRRRVLEVPWVRQHHNTCSPATLASVCGYWQHPAEHLEIAEEICFGGTPAHSERRWARTNELVGREFTADWATAVELIDRGVPFTLVTSDAASAHLQAVVGYDLRRRSFLCRDPSVRQLVEIDADRLFEKLRSTGPRGMVLLPPGELERLAGLELPEAGLYDLYDAVEGALAEHDREVAVRHLATLSERAAGHRLELFARRAVAAYDSDVPRLLALVEELLALYPDDERLQMARISYLGQLGRRSDRIAELRRRVDSRTADPIFGLQLANELAVDARHAREAERLLANLLSRRPDHAPGYLTLGDALWDRDEHDRALVFYRWAACLGETDEGLQFRYLATCNHLDRREEAMSFLERRNDRLGKLSGRPAVTLAVALEGLDRHDDALQVATEARRQLPDDEDILAYLVRLHSRRGDLDASRSLLETLEGRTSPSSFLSLRAQLAEVDGDLVAALDDLEALLAADPTSVDLHAHVARLTAMLHGYHKARQHLAAAVGRFPHHVPLRELQVQWSWQDGAAGVIPVLRELLAEEPENAWAQRELAGALLQVRDVEGAQAACELAASLEPSSPSLVNLRGQIQEETGQVAEATAAYRVAVERDPDNAFAVGRLPRVGRTAESQREALRWIATHLGRCTGPDSVHVFLERARRFLPPDEVLALLRDLHAQHGERWIFWTALAEQLAQMDKPDEALQLVERAVDRFPFRIDVWRTAAQIHQIAGREAEETSTLRRLLEIEPNDTESRFRLASLHLAAGRLLQAQREAETARARDPLDPSILRLLAEIHWESGDHGAALDAVEESLELDPTERDLWQTLKRLGAGIGQPERALDAARRLLERRQSDALAWSVLADVSDDEREARRAIDQAIELAPRSVDLHLQKANLLAGMNDLSAAHAALKPEVFGDQRPTELLGEEAMLLAQLGDMDAAIRTMNQAVEEDPAYVFGWSQLTEWHVDRKDWKAAGEAAERWILHAPNHPIAWGFRGEIERSAGDKDAAITSFRKALTLEPGYAFAGLNLSRLLEKQARRDEALAVVVDLVEHVDAARAFYRALELSIKQGGHPHQARWIHGLSQAPDADGAVTRDALDLVAGSKPELLAAWDEASLADEVTAPMAELRVQQVAERDGFEAAWKHLLRIDNAKPAWGRAAGHALELEMRAGKPTRARKRIRKHASKLRRVTDSWGKAGYIYAASGRWDKVVSWLSDYEKREDAEPWMLVNLSLAHRVLKNDAAAYEVSRLALKRDRVQDNTMDFHLYWVAIWEALQGDPRGVLALPPRPEREADDSEERVLYHLARGLAEVAGKRGDRRALQRAKQWLTGGTQPIRCPDQHQQRIYNKVAYHIARQVGGFMPWLWAFSHLRK